MNHKIILFLLFLAFIAFAHGEEEHAEEMPAPPEPINTLWFIHSWTHWMVWIGFIYTCYYFRFFIGHKLGHPSHCAVPEKEGEYLPEDSLKQIHGIFVWLMIIWTAIHISEIIGGQFGYGHPEVYSLSELIPGEEIWEWMYVVSTVLFLSSCHYIRYLTGSGTKCFSCLAFGRQRQKVFTIQTFLNNYHGHFFWIAIIASVLVLLSGGHL
ncbi:MAG TPA: hypothetical protein VJH24_03380 [Candidatus Bilamarchaeaceae archaeon]|uniref:Uncharacterized protein n=1 Tax=Candidatus Magasanikbacteria bacterium RIFCSPHIGHO2_02_FULL_50_9b TaxID=1798682 RepID=A0A1F6M8U3_9BACT|nr:MAG: hypothetical protein A3C15_00850 [Candidatus Magasanikbacteria bacterium RIFCSPHIGHO2_02_FULL_50_9b]HLC68858.1 hypothetical protein [Candidatus Bilamarchaeaceae archaeon]